MDKPKGLNGDPAFSAKDVPVGYVPGGSYGYKRNLLVTVSVRMEWLNWQEFYYTVDHGTVARPLEFAITSAVWRPDRKEAVSVGASLEPLTEIVKVVEPFTQDDIDRLIRLGGWHLNSMSAGCAHQDTNAGTGSPPCPISGYRWGSAHLLRPLSDSFLDDVKELFYLVDDDLVWSAS